MMKLSQIVMKSEMESLNKLQRMAAAKQTLDAIKNKYLDEKDEGQGPASLRDETLKAILLFGIGKYRDVHCSEIGVHPWNRSESGVDPSEVHCKIGKCQRAGYSLIECSKAALLERPEGAKGIVLNKNEHDSDSSFFKRCKACKTII